MNVVLLWKVENIEAKEEADHHEYSIFIFFQKLSAEEASKIVCMWERFNRYDVENGLKRHLNCVMRTVYLDKISVWNSVTFEQKLDH